MLKSFIRSEVLFMKLSTGLLRRLPLYLRYLQSLDYSIVNISATTIATALKLGEVQVRKDLGMVSGRGRPKTGYNRLLLIETLQDYLGYNKIKKAVIFGAGQLGNALMSYNRFDDYGLKIVAAFDIKNIGISSSGKPVYPIDSFSEFCKKEEISIGIITVPSTEAQKVCDVITDNGIKAVWNFAPAQLYVPSDVIIYEENMAASLALLCKQMEETR